MGDGAGGAGCVAGPERCGRGGGADLAAFAVGSAVELCDASLAGGSSAATDAIAIVGAEDFCRGASTAAAATGATAAGGSPALGLLAKAQPTPTAEANTNTPARA